MSEYSWSTHIHKGKWGTRKCVTCGREYEPVAGNQKYCLWSSCSPGAIGSKARFMIFQRDEFCCFYCGRNSYENGIRLHLEHLIPKSRGGLTRADNVITACSKCNCEKGAFILAPTILSNLQEEIRDRNKKHNIENDSVVDKVA